MMEPAIIRNTTAALTLTIIFTLWLCQMLGIPFWPKTWPKRKKLLEDIFFFLFEAFELNRTIVFLLITAFKETWNER